MVQKEGDMVKITKAPPPLLKVLDAANIYVIKQYAGWLFQLIHITWKLKVMVIVGLQTRQGNVRCPLPPLKHAQSFDLRNVVICQF